MKISIKLRAFSDGLFERIYGGGREELHQGADGEGGGVRNTGGGERVGRAIVGGSTVGVSSTSKNHPLHHKYKPPKQFELKQS